METALHQALGSVLWEVGTLPTVRLIMPASQALHNKQMAMAIMITLFIYLFILPSSNWLELGNSLSLLYVSITSN